MDTGDEEEDNEEDDPATPLGNSTPRSSGSKRASSTSTTARSPSKKSKSAAVQSVDTNMTRFNELVSGRNELLENLWRGREEREEAARTDHRNRVDKVYELAAELGVTAEATPDLFEGVMHTVESDNRMQLFFRANPAERRFLLQEYSRVKN